MNEWEILYRQSPDYAVKREYILAQTRDEAWAKFHEQKQPTDKALSIKFMGVVKNDSNR
jgi:hypothetical protein